MYGWEEKRINKLLIINFRDLSNIQLNHVSERVFYTRYEKARAICGSLSAKHSLYPFLSLYVCDIHYNVLIDS